MVFRNSSQMDVEAYVSTGGKFNWLVLVVVLETLSI